MRPYDTAAAAGEMHDPEFDKPWVQEPSIVGTVDIYAGDTHIAEVFDVASAPVIQAAPDLLAAVEHVLQASEDGGTFADVDFAMLRAAANKARG